MKTLPFLGIVPALCLLLGCGHGDRVGESSSKEKVVHELSPEDVFNYPLVALWMKQHQEPNEEAKNLFLSGLDQFKNKRHRDSAIWYFNASLIKSPSNVAYYELGNVNLETGKLKEALVCYEMAERLGYEPLSKVMYNMACVQAQLENVELAGQYLQFAIQAGYTNFEHMEKDPDLGKFRNSYFYRESIKNALNGMTDPQNQFWLQFKRQFGVAQLPFSIKEGMKGVSTSEEVQISYDYEKYISEMRDSEFSRDVSQMFFYLSKIAENDRFVALVYIVQDNYYDAEAPIQYKLVTFTPRGKLIDKKVIGGRKFLGDPLMESVIRPDLSLALTTWETIYKKDPEEFGYDKNPIVSRNKLNEEKFQINAEGKIELEKSMNKEAEDKNISLNASGAQ